MSRLAGSGCEIIIPELERKTNLEIERSLVKKFNKVTWSPFIRAIKEFEMIKDGDKVAVGISGGKDSLLLAKLLQELQKHKKKDFTLEFISMDPGFHPTNRQLLEDLCSHLEIPVKIFKNDLFEVVEKISDQYPCYLCARMRRGALYQFAQNSGCNKLALGHHMDDVVETIMMNVLCAGTYMTMMPRIKSTNFENMELIRPLYYVREDNIKKFSRYAGLAPMNCGCAVAAKKTSSKRSEVKELIKSLSGQFQDVEKSILQSAKNVHIDAIIEYKDKNGRHNFLERFKDAGRQE